MKQRKNTNTIERVVSRLVHRDGDDGCWEWPGGTNNGYGRTIIDGKHYYVHRLSFLHHHGRWPDACALHICDNRRCGNPAHLFEGDRAANCKDCSRKGRMSRGSDRWNTTLTEDDVREIRAARARGLQLKPIATQFGVSVPTVSTICARKTWRHV